MIGRFVLKTKESNSPAAPKIPAPNSDEQAAIAAARARVAERPPRVGVDLAHKDGNQLDIRGGGHNDHDGWLARLEDAFGTRGTAFPLSQLNILVSTCQDSKGKVDTMRLNAMLAMIEGAKPESELQAALAVQIALAHYTTASLISRSMRADQIPQFDSAGNMAVKFARALAAQVEALAKLQRRGEQVVKVVHVYSGGQAIVGDVTTGAPSGAAGGGGSGENGNQPHAKAITAAAESQIMSSLRGENAERELVPVARGQR